MKNVEHHEFVDPGSGSDHERRHCEVCGLDDRNPVHERPRMVRR